MGFGAGLEHHDAGVFRHPTKRKICRMSALMATGAFSFRPPSLPMARAEMRKKSRRVYGNGHGVPMTPRPPWIAESKSQNRKAGVLRSRTHARTHAQFPGFGGLRSPVFLQPRRREARRIFFVRVTQQGHLSGSPHGGSSLR